MIFKKKHTLSMLCCSVILLFAARVTEAANGEITINGKVYEASCVVDSGSKTINLENVTKSELTSATNNSVIRVKPHTISVTGCPTNITPAFSFDTNDNNIDGTSTGTLKNKDSSGAGAGVGVQLLNSSGAAIDFNLYSVSIAGATQSIPLKAGYFVKDNADISSGNVMASIGYLFTYP
jgi:major type 1 subunit fimbrin (pilin)